jgi:hypothetical protein
MDENFQRDLNGDNGEEAQEAAWRELIRSSVEMAFDSRSVVVSDGVRLSVDLFSYG